MSDSEVLIRVEHVSKKFCRSLKRSLWYGAQDVANSLMPWKRNLAHDNTDGNGIFRESELRKDEFWAVRDVSFQVRRGECLGLIGHNGAGKSTLLKVLNSLNSPTEGRITLKGRIGALIELSAGFNPILTGRENIFNQAALLGFSRQETNSKFDSIVGFSELEPFLDMPMQNYSSGMKVRLGFAVASQLEPDILIIDEVLAVGDVGFRLKCLNKMAELLSKSAVIFVSHSMSQIHRVCTDLMVMENGVATYSGENISAGVNKYFSGFADSESSVTGSGEVTVSALSVSSDQGEYASGSAFHLDQKSKLQFQFDLQADLVNQKCRLGVVIWNSELYPIADLVQRGGALHIIEFDAGGKTTVSIEIDELNLAAGRYTLSLHFTDPASTRVYCRVDNAIVMVVQGAMVGGGGNLIESSVQVLNRV